MKSIFSQLIIVFEFISFLVSLFLYTKKNLPGYLIFFPPFLFITVVVEAIGAIFNVERRALVMMIYNYFSVLEFIFYFFVVYHFINSALVKRIIIITGILYPVIAVLYILQRVGKMHAATYSIGSVLLVCFCLYYFYEFFKLPDAKQLIYEAPFLICLGLLFYYSCTLPIFAFWGMGHKNQFEITTAALIIGIANYLLYSLFSIAFLCRIQIREPKLSQ